MLTINKKGHSGNETALYQIAKIKFVSYRSCGLTVLRRFASVRFMAASRMQYTLQLIASKDSEAVIIFLLLMYARILLATTNESFPFAAAFFFAIF
jgi:hypothetical protein